MKCQLKRTRLHDVREPMFNRTWELYTQSFPADERRLPAGQSAVMAKNEYRCEWIEADGHLAGLLFWWSVAGMRYVEHVATSPGMRGKGLGKQILEDFIAESVSPILLEVEKPELAVTPAEQWIRQRRVDFYTRLNFILNRHEYYQPPYFPGGERLNLYVMSYQQPLSKETLAEFVSGCHPVIYGPECPTPPRQGCCRNGR